MRVKARVKKKKKKKSFKSLQFDSGDIEAILCVPLTLSDYWCYFLVTFEEWVLHSQI